MTSNFVNFNFSKIKIKNYIHWTYFAEWQSWTAWYPLNESLQTVLNFGSICSNLKIRENISVVAISLLCFLCLVRQNFFEIDKLLLKEHCAQYLQQNYSPILWIELKKWRTRKFHSPHLFTDGSTSNK